MDLIVVYKNIELPSLFLEVNVELKFKYSNIAVFRIVEFKNKSYILDPTTIKGKSYFFGSLPKEVTAEMVELIVLE